MDKPATQANSELNTKHRTKKTEREIKNGQSSDSDNSELSTKQKQRKPIGKSRMDNPATQTTVN
jgi:hypothetical protein